MKEKREKCGKEGSFGAKKQAIGRVRREKTCGGRRGKEGKEELRRE